jgi:hypothetical protein
MLLWIFLTAGGPGLIRSLDRPKRPRRACERLGGLGRNQGDYRGVSGLVRIKPSRHGRLRFLCRPHTRDDRDKTPWRVTDLVSSSHNAGRQAGRRQCPLSGAKSRRPHFNSARSGRRHKCAIGAVHPYGIDELSFIFAGTGIHPAPNHGRSDLLLLLAGSNARAQVLGPVDPAGLKSARSTSMASGANCYCRHKSAGGVRDRQQLRHLRPCEVEGLPFWSDHPI